MTLRNGTAILLTVLNAFIYSIHGQDNARMIYDRGVDYGIQGQFDLAATEFRYTLEIDSLYVPAKLNLVVVEDVLAQKISPVAGRLYFSAVFQGNQDNFDQKISDLNAALDINPDFALAYNERGIAWARKQEYSRAIDDYNRASALLPNYPEIYFNQALSCDNAGRYAEANAAYRKFLEYTPVSYTWYIIYARKRIWEMENPTSPDSSQ